ncbi:hypothetical protein AAF712_010307 [Marasmius tenuissimus]|uniref:Uncharacterized protein n=1 Tax=Marasmius tenuissimus TaxID=585030 RepID=A0ABR2ZPC7_9AGAR
MSDQTDDPLLPQAAALWKKPSDLIMDPHDRKHNYEVRRFSHFRAIAALFILWTACAWLALVAVDGHLYRRVKEDIQDPDDANWTNKDPCPVYLTKGFDLDEACFLTCACKKKLYCAGCSALLNSGANGSSPIGPICERDSYFVSSKWVFVHDAAARDRAKKESRKKYEKVKRANRKKRGAPLE